MNSKISNFIKALFVLIFGSLFALIALEFGIRGFSRYYLYSNSELNHQRVASENTILAYGDSFTFGMGASDPTVYSYSAQLQNMILSENKKSDIKVVRVGYPGKNSSYLCDWLDYHLKQVAPKIVLFTGGKVNFWNSEGYVQKSPQPFLDFFEKYFGSVVKLIRFFDFVFHPENTTDDRKFIGLSVQKRLEYQSALELMQYKNYSQLSIYCNEMFKKQPDDVFWSVCMSEFFFRQDKDLAKATHWLNKALQNKKKSELACYLGFDLSLLMDRVDLAKKWIMPFYGCPFDSKIRDALLSYVNTDDQERLKKGIIIEANTGNSLTLNERFFVQEWIIRDLKEMMYKTEKAGARLILQTYPLAFSASEKELNIIGQSALYINQIIRNFAISNDIQLIDHAELFYKKSTVRGQPLDYYFISDGHCNRYGYQLMAENIYEALKIF